ncbi:class I SAM-dependent methyltransferase [Alicycliphilus sp. T452]
MTFWDQAFDIPGYKYGTAPNAFVREQAARLRPGGRVLVPGDGEGRNGVWLAAQGHEVLSVDGSAVGLAKARELARQQGVPLRTELADLAQWTPGPAGFDAVVLTYVHLPSAIRADAHRRLAAALRPGGWLVLEAFTPQQLAYASGGPKDADMLYSTQQLRADFAGLLREELAWDGVVQLDEGPGHQGAAHVLRWLAQAPENVFMVFS